MIKEGEKYPDLVSLTKELLEMEGQVVDSLIVSSHSVEDNSIVMMSIKWNEENLEWEVGKVIRK